MSSGSLVSGWVLDADRMMFMGFSGGDVQG